MSTGDWSNITSACWLKAGVKSDVFTRFSVVVAGTGGSEVRLAETLMALLPRSIANAEIKTWWATV